MNEMQRLPARVIRFIITTAIGAIPLAGMIAGPVADAIDSFVLDRLRFGGLPKFLIESVRQTQPGP